MGETEKYFTKLAEIRKAALVGGSANLRQEEIEFIRRYESLMSATSRSAEMAVKIRPAMPVSMHELWATNALARYFCYVEQDFARCEGALIEAVIRLETGFEQGLSPIEANVLLPILLLNFVRAARMAGDLETAGRRLVQLKALLWNPVEDLDESTDRLDAFPEEICRRTKWIKNWMRVNLSLSGMGYLRDKIEALEKKMGAL